MTQYHTRSSKTVNCPTPLSTTLQRCHHTTGNLPADCSMTSGESRLMMTCRQDDHFAPHMLPELSKICRRSVLWHAGNRSILSDGGQQATHGQQRLPPGRAHRSAPSSHGLPSRYTQCPPSPQLHQKASQELHVTATQSPERNAALQLCLHIALEEDTCVQQSPLTSL